MSSSYCVIHVHLEVESVSEKMGEFGVENIY